jgi:hypothetical protein
MEKDRTTMTRKKARQVAEQWKDSSALLMPLMPLMLVAFLRLNLKNCF